MIRHIFAAATTCLLAGVASAAAPTSYAVLSLVGDKIDIVTYQPQIGSQLDSNTHMPLAFPSDEFDTVALRTVNRAIKASAPGLPVALLAASTAETFTGQAAMFSGDHVTLPAEMDAAVRREGATTLVLITKHHGEARMLVQQGYIGSGKIEGLGFYVDTNTHMQAQETGERSVGFLAPFVYIDVWLIDVATGTVTRRASVASGQAISTAHNPESVHPWDVISTEAKVATLKTMLADDLAAIVPGLITGKPDQPVATAADPHP